MTDAIDTLTLANEWLARIAPDAPGYRNELTAARLTAAIGSRRFADLYTLSLTRPDLDAAALARAVDMEHTPIPADTDGMLDACRRDEYARLLADAHPDADRCLRARFELDQLAASHATIRDAVRDLDLLSAWLAGDRLAVRQYADAQGTASVLVGAAVEYAKRDARAAQRDHTMPDLEAPRLRSDQ